MTVPVLGLAAVKSAWDRFFFTEQDALPFSFLRIGYGLLLLFQATFMYPTLRFYFSEQGVVPYALSRQMALPNAPTIFQLLPHTNAATYSMFGLFAFSALCLTIGLWPRCAAIGTYLCLVSFDHRNSFITDGSDVIFRVLGLMIIFLPHDKLLSLSRTIALLRGKEAPGVEQRQAWPCVIRFIQVYMAFVLFCTWCWKVRGAEWLDGTALYYVSRLDDSFGHFPLPAFPFEYMWCTQVLTWSVLVVEGLGPWLLWVNETRRYALLAILAFHLGCEYAMNLFLFHWVMMLGWATYFTASEGVAIGAALGRGLMWLGIKPVVIRYDPSSSGLRTAAALAEWDAFSLLRCEPDAAAGSFVVTVDGRAYDGIPAIRCALRALPLAWWMLPLTYLPPVARWLAWPAPALAADSIRAAS